MSYTNVFGGDNINPASLSYKFYAINGPLALVWPFEALDGANVLAAKMDVQAQAAGLHVFMPDASLVSVGEDVLWNNVGVNAFTVVDFHGNTIITVEPNTQWFTYLTNNTTQNGVWKSTQFGASTSVANAASLAGAGLRARDTFLDQNLTTVPLGTTQLTQGNRATLAENTGGAATYTFDPAATLTNGWFVYVVNAGTNNLTLQPTAGETIDGSPSKVLQPGESCIVFSTGVDLRTVGYGRSISSNVTSLIIDVSGTGFYQLSAVQIAAQVQDYSGTVTGLRNISYEGAKGYWFVWNNTTNLQPLHFFASLADPTGVTVAPGTYSILRSNGSSVEIAFSTGTAGVTSINFSSADFLATPNPITSTGNVALRIPPPFSAAPATFNVGRAGTGQTPTTVTLVPFFTINNRGVIQNAGDFALNISLTTPIPSQDFGKVITDATGYSATVANNLVFNQSPLIYAPSLKNFPTVTPTAFPTTDDPITGHFNDSTIANTRFVTTALLPYAPLSSPVFTGNPTGPTPAPGDNDFSLATTAFVTDAVHTALITPIQVQTFTGSGTFTPTKSGVFRVMLVGGGGGGAGTANSPALALGGAGGGAGATVIAYMTLTAATGYPVVIGGGGGGGAPSSLGNTGGGGGATTFNGAVANGGGPGVGGNTGGPAGTGGTGSGGSINLQGGNGTRGIGGAYAPANPPSGCTDNGQGGSSSCGSWPAPGSGGIGGFPQNAAGASGINGIVMIEQISFT